MEILKCDDYNNYTMAVEFLDSFDSFIKESDHIKHDSPKDILKNTAKVLGVNLSFIATFGTAIDAMYPIVNELVQNMNLKIELTTENVVLLTIAALTIIYLEEKKIPKERKSDIKTILEELKLRGIGNGIVKKVIECFKSIGNIFKIIAKHIRKVVGSLSDMFGYTAILIPCMNAIKFMIGKYDLNLDTLPGNFLSLGVGIVTIIARQGIAYILDKIGDKLKIDKEEVIDDLDDTIIQKYPYPDFTNVSSDKIEDIDLIKERK